MIEYSNVGLIQRFGKFQKILHEGLHPVNPMTENIIIINMKTQVYHKFLHISPRLRHRFADSSPRLGRYIQIKDH